MAALRDYHADKHKYKDELQKCQLNLRMLFLGAHDRSEYCQVPLRRANGLVQWTFALNRQCLRDRDMLVDKMWLRCRAEFTADKQGPASITEKFQLPFLNSETMFDVAGRTLYVRKAMNAITLVLSGNGRASLHLVSNNLTLTTSRHKRTFGMIWNFNVDTSKKIDIYITILMPSKSLKFERRLALVGKSHINV